MLKSRRTVRKCCILTSACGLAYNLRVLGTAAILPIGIGSLFALACLIAGFWAMQRKRLIDDLPTSKTQGVFVGLTELKGTAESESPLTSYLAAVRCVQYSWQIDEHWSRTVVETYTDSKGHAQTRTRTETGWTKVADGRDSQPFYLKDDTGVIRIVPDGARINAVNTYNETLSRDNPLYFDKGPAREVANTTHKRRFQETALPLHAALYIVGQARERQDVVAAEVAYQKNTPMFLISTKAERQISSGYGRWGWFWIIIGLVLAAAGAFVSGVSPATGLGLSTAAVAVSCAVYILAFILGWIWAAYNSLVTLHHRVEQGWSQVDVELKRRSDLIPNLVAAVAGYSEHEKTTQEAVTQLRQQIEATPPGVAGPDFKGMAPLLRVVTEQYPDLKANEAFLGLQHSLEDTEQRIALARDYYNDIATFYNSRLQIVPDRYVGSLARLRPQTLMSASDFERAPVRVKLAS